MATASPTLSSPLTITLAARAWFGSIGVMVRRIHGFRRRYPSEGARYLRSPTLMVTAVTRSLLRETLGEGMPAISTRFGYMTWVDLLTGPSCGASSWVTRGIRARTPPLPRYRRPPTTRLTRQPQAVAASRLTPLVSTAAAGARRPSSAEPRLF